MYLYQKIKSYLLELIFENKLAQDFKLPSENALAQKFNTTRVTAKKALRELEDDDIVYSVHGKGTFVHESQRPLDSTPKELVCMFLPNLNSQFITDIINGAKEILNAKGIHLLITLLTENENTNSSLINKVIASGVKGIMLFTTNNFPFHQELSDLANKNYPMVLIDRFAKDVDTSSVCSNHKTATKNAVKMLIDDGHKNIGFITYPTEYASSLEMRLEGYIEAHEKAGLEVTYDNILFLNDNSNSYEKIYEFIAENPQITGLLSIGDAIGLNVCKTIQKLNISVPNDFRVIFFDKEYDNFECFLPFKPEYIIQNGHRIGSESAKIILFLLKNLNSIVHNKILVDCTMA